MGALCWNESLRNRCQLRGMVREITNEQFLERIGELRTLLNNILRRKVNWIGHILRRN